MARLTFDPKSENAANSALDVFDTPDGSVEVSAMSFPPPPLDITSAPAAEGELPSARRHQNRQISLTLEVLEPEGGQEQNLLENPSFEVDTSQWVGASAHWLVSGSARSRIEDPADAAVGDAYLRVTADAEDEGVATTVALFGGETYAVTVRVRRVSGGPVEILVGEESSPFAMHTVASATLPTTWTEQTLVFTPVDDGDYELVIRQSTAAAVTFDVDAALVAESSEVVSYFDGDTPGCEWIGTPHASTSARPAPGGPRLRATVADIEAKAAKLAAEGGTLRWINDDDDVFTFDILAADGYELPYDIAYFTGPAATVTMSLTAKPYARWPEVTRTAESETTLPVLTALEDDVPGDVPALGRLLITEPSGQTQKHVIWAIQSQHYDAAATADLFYQAEACTAGLASTAVGPAGASGGGSNTMKDTALATTWRQSFSKIGTHVGDFRIFARVHVPSANAGTVSVYVKWRAGEGPHNTNPTVEIDPALEDNWLLLDLGTVSFPAVAHGAQQSVLELQAASTSAGDDISWDWIAYVPISEGYGEATEPTAPLAANTPPLYATTGELMITSGQVIARTASSSAWGVPEKYEGDHLLIPPTAGGRTVRWFLKVKRSGSDSLVDAAIDDMTVQWFITPRWLSIR